MTIPCVRSISPPTPVQLLIDEALGLEMAHVSKDHRVEGILRADTLIPATSGRIKDIRSLESQGPGTYRLSFNVAWLPHQAVIAAQTPLQPRPSPGLNSGIPVSTPNLSSDLAHLRVRLWEILLRKPHTQIGHHNASHGAAEHSSAAAPACRRWHSISSNPGSDSQDSMSLSSWPTRPLRVFTKRLQADRGSC